MLKKIWYYLFNQKEEYMPVSSENVVEETNTLKKQASAQEERINHLQSSVSSLTDELALIKSDIATFKTGVSKDMKRIVVEVEKVQNNHTLGRLG